MLRRMLNAAAYYNRYGPDKSVPSRRTRQSIHRINCHAAYVKQDGKTVARVKSTSLNSTPEITWLHHDHLGSAVAGTKADGTTAWTEKYTPFGISMVNAADNDNQAGFTGHIKDSDTGLTYMQARYYDPVIGRFLSHDPVGFLDAGDPGYFNRYSYGLNDPVNMIDPSGKSSCRSGNNSCENLGDRASVKSFSGPDGSVTKYKPVEVKIGDKTIETGGAAVRRLPQASANGAPANVPEVVESKLFELSEVEGATVEVTSGVRTAEQNAAVGGAPNSNHLENGNAAVDIRIPGQTPGQTADAAHDSGIFNRVNEYDPALPTYRRGSGVHVDNKSTGNQGRFTNWVHQPDP